MGNMIEQSKQMTEFARQQLEQELLEKIAVTEQENKELKAKLEVTQAVVDEIALGGMM